ncbi:hypothetical protein [Dactylosporangium sp. CA-092794]|uniref:hypothetical protein n=1 Tax=Dactylosporangium sp. CA-092794 TaxID=3239929 RepID=UPI003D9466E4
MTALLFPVGHLLARPAGPAQSITAALGGGTVPTGPRDARVRVGDAVRRLTQVQFLAWSAAHGDADAGPDTAGRTRPQVEHWLRDQGLSAPDRTVQELLADRLLAEADPHGSDAVGFARGHRVNPLLWGLGNSPEEPWLFSIGLMGQEVARVGRAMFEIWAWGPVDSDLWSSCRTFAELERDDDNAEDPGHVLAGFLDGLHGLLAVQAAYLDVSST